MWLKAFQSGDKLLSESEFWILTLVGDELESPTEIIDRLLQQTVDWTPKAGTIYPILHRLAESGLLDKNEENGLLFRRSHKARVFLSSIGKPLRVQLNETCNYYQQILNNLGNLEKMPVRYDKILASLVQKTTEFRNSLAELAIEVKNKTDQPYDVPVSFED